MYVIYEVKNNIIMIMISKRTVQYIPSAGLPMSSQILSLAGSVLVSLVASFVVSSRENNTDCLPLHAHIESIADR